MPLILGPIEAAQYLGGGGELKMLLGTDPGLGAEVNVVVPVGKQWRVHAFAVSLTTDATVGNRTPKMQVKSSSDVVLLETETAAAQVVSTTVRYLVGDYRTATSPKLTFPFPLILPTGVKITTLTGGLLAGDNYGAPLLLIEEFEETV